MGQYCAGRKPSCVSSMLPVTRGNCWTLVAEAVHCSLHNSVLENNSCTVTTMAGYTSLFYCFMRSSLVLPILQEQKTQCGEYYSISSPPSNNKIHQHRRRTEPSPPKTLMTGLQPLAPPGQLHFSIQAKSH